MSIFYDEKAKLFTLQTNGSTYQMKVAQHGFLLHLYYGKRVDGMDLSYLIHYADHGFSGNPHDVGTDRTFSLDVLPQEYPCFGTGDYRTPCLSVTHADGSTAADLRYVSHRICKGKPSLPGLPAVYSENGEAETLEITLRDVAAPLAVKLLYSVFADMDVICRSCEIINEDRDGKAVFLDHALSCCLDFPEGNYDIMTFYGRHTRERNVERTPLRHGKIVSDSVRGASSHQQNPFVILCAPGADEEYGECFGASFVYSGNFAITAEKDQLDQTRLAVGINPVGFCWRLAAGESFQTPETVLCYHDSGLGGLSRKLHLLFREHLCRGEYKNKRRPILINNWEATYFDFDEDKLVEIASSASALGVEMLVMDDGWFGQRDSDDSGLGDWVVNETRLRGGLSSLCKRVNALGMKLGIWFEPEMISEDSDLYRAHPDWSLHMPGRAGTRSRFQFVLDMSRKEVVDYLDDAISRILSSANLEYVKWDMNRHLSEVWSAALPPERQGEVSHRYMLGVYDLLERLTSRFPHILFEGCSGGGGRFDAGMLYYTPQIWCSDNTDAIDRIAIQYGTSFGYPVSAVGSHVSAVPNHQTGRVTPFQTRAAVAMAGTFGYELDISRLSAEEKDQIKEQIQFYRRHYETIRSGNYYRLTSPDSHCGYAAWQFVSADGSHSLLEYISLQPESNAPARFIKLKGLDVHARYQVSRTGGETGEFSGSALLHAGLIFPPQPGDYAAQMIEIHRL